MLSLKTSTLYHLEQIAHKKFIRHMEDTIQQHYPGSSEYGHNFIHACIHKLKQYGITQAIYVTEMIVMQCRYGCTDLFHWANTVLQKQHLNPQQKMFLLRKIKHEPSATFTALKL